MAKNLNKLRKNLIGLELGASGVKLVVGDFVKDNFVVRQVIQSPLPDNIYTDGHIQDMDMVVKGIKNSLKQQKVKAKDCLSCLDSSQIITREVTIPSNNQAHLSDMAKYEVEQFLPVEMDNYAVQSLVIKELEIEDKPFAEMLVTAFPKKLIDQMHKVITASGLRALVLDTQANAFGKLIEGQTKINGNSDFQDGTAAFIDFGYESIKLQIFHKGKFRFSRTLRFGGRDLDTNISKFMDVSNDDARKLKMNMHNINYAVDEHSDQAKLNNVVRSTLSSWLDEVGKIFRYYVSRNPGSKGIEYIYIYGGISNITGMTDFIEGRFHVPTDQIRKLSGVDVPNGIDLSDILNTLGVFYRR